jgi:hypothetical protein
MRIRINTIQGLTENDLTNINNLNHYIGMKRIVPESIPELRYMPWLVGAVIVTGLAVAAWGNRKALYAWVGGFGALALAGMIDFWWWEYDYGHNLDFEHAIIKVPGMTYQPPLIGTKQLLNFTATSWPGPGGWMAFAAFALALAALVLTLRARRATATTTAPAKAPRARAHAAVA